MAYTDAGQGISVDVGECRCPGTPHASDEVLLAPKLTVPMGAAAMAALGGQTTVAGNQAVLTEVWFSPPPLGGIIAWSFVEKAKGDDGEPTTRTVPLTPDNIARLLPWSQGGYEIASKIDELYGPELFRPLAPRLPESLPTGPTVVETSASSMNGSKPAKHSKSSSLSDMEAGKPFEVPVP